MDESLIATIDKAWVGYDILFFLENIYLDKSAIRAKYYRQIILPLRKQCTHPGFKRKGGKYCTICQYWIS